MSGSLPVVIVSGASGFVGRHFLEAARGEYRIYALARRSQQQARIPPHPDLTWIQVDIADWSTLKAVMQNIKRRGGADFVLHLAGYYDFTYRDHPEYRRTNVNGTRHMLELAKWLCVRRFFFASSLAACSFPGPGEALTESSPPDADFAYAHSKREGEEMVREYSAHFAGTILRFAAVFSDWCEYPPLYAFLGTWTSRRWNARILAGRGASSCAYIHVHELARMILWLMRHDDAWPRLAVHIANGGEDVTHQQLYEATCRAWYGRVPSPCHVPGWLARPGVLIRQVGGTLLGRPPFERLWMLRYIDRRMRVDDSATRKMLNWNPAPRSRLLPRLLHLVERMRAHPREWHLYNQAALERVAVRPNLVIHDALAVARPSLLQAFRSRVTDATRADRFTGWQRIPTEELDRHTGILFDLLLASVRTGDRTLIVDHVADLAPGDFERTQIPREVTAYLMALNDVILDHGRQDVALRAHAGALRDAVSLTLQMAAGEATAAHQRLLDRRRSLPESEGRTRSRRVAARELEQMIDRLNAIYQVVADDETAAGDRSV